MPKSKSAPSRSKRRQSGSGGGKLKGSFGGHYPKGRRLRDGVLTVVVAGGLVGWLAYSWWQWSQESRGFEALAAAGEGAIGEVVTERSLGRRHLAMGEVYRYSSSAPTSGPHAPIWTNAGFYETAQIPEQLVHALEHGNIVIYYDRPGDAVLDRLKAWSDLYGGQWDGLVVSRKSGLGEGILLTAWTKKLELAAFDEAAAAAFIDAFRGRGPEHRVR